MFFAGVLVADSGDNAYSYLFLVGGALVVAAVPFALTALLPSGETRRAFTRAALGMLALVGLLALGLLLLSVAIIPSQDYQSDTVLINHLIGLMALGEGLGTQGSRSHGLRRRSHAPARKNRNCR